MTILESLREIQPEMTDWRRDIHKHPETAFEEERTSDKVAKLLESFGMEVHRGLAKTGVVGSLKAGTGNRAIGLRADMDALDLTELNQFDHKSVHDGKMHACGHDGHTAMLLGAACHLARTKDFDGTVHFIFQPAEENLAGGRVMVDEGLFERFPVEAVYGMHNWPGMAVGTFGVCEGPMMASADFFELVLTGRGGHGAYPHMSRDPVLAAAHVITAWQSIVSRNVDPMKAAVISATQIESGFTGNVIPETATIRGTTRTFDMGVQDMIEERMRKIATSVAEGFDMKASFDYQRRYCPTVNSPEETGHAIAAARAVVGDENVNDHITPHMGAEDFGWMLKARPGCYVFTGNGKDGLGGCEVHNPNYDFNDNALPVGAAYWVQLVQMQLPAAGA
ncbi:M20 aminoacylase family protein [Minwuia sp.]|uniref:M20 aminoacylase family protein n=1 Tax=Minwuia sp. TaxID=2493630 RepID=UPI003A93D91C